MWKIYDALIENIPGNILAKDVRVGRYYGTVSTENSFGAGISISVESRLPLYENDWRNRPIKDIAACAKSWNFMEASIGVAAINAYYNSEETATQNHVQIPQSSFAEDRLNDPFISYQKQVKDKNVAVVGHFPYLETLFEPVCSLSIIETKLNPGDYPFSACEYLLPESDFVFLSCRSLSDKTLPRLLQLSEHAYTIIVGPATPLAPVLFEFGVDDLSGFVFQNHDKADYIITGGQFGTIYSTGHKVSLSKEDYLLAEAQNPLSSV